MALAATEPVLEDEARDGAAFAHAGCEGGWEGGKEGERVSLTCSKGGFRPAKFLAATEAVLSEAMVRPSSTRLPGEGGREGGILCAWKCPRGFS